MNIFTFHYVFNFLISIGRLITFENYLSTILKEFILNSKNSYNHTNITIMIYTY